RFLPRRHSAIAGPAHAILGLRPLGKRKFPETGVSGNDCLLEGADVRLPGYLRSRSHRASQARSAELPRIHPKITLPLEFFQQLTDLGQQHRASVFMVAVAALDIMLSRYSGQTDIILGVPM